MPSDPWYDFWVMVDRLSQGLSASKAVNVNSANLRALAREIAQNWFRIARPFVLQLGVVEAEVEDIDEPSQNLLRLSTGGNAKTIYVGTVKHLRIARRQLGTKVELLQGVQSAKAVAGHGPSNIETAILTTLERIPLRSAAMSYRQVLADLLGPPRVSYRGTATELREAVRETLDHLAPDKDVMESPGFKLEKDRKGPTMKQKARFILKARGVGETSRKAPEDAVELLEEHIAGFARSVYERGAASTHSTTTIESVRSFKAYADAILSELLQVHRT